MRRSERPWTVLEIIETDDGHRCVDLFRRHDSTFGYEEFRRDPGDRGAVRFASSLSYNSLQAARAAAETAVTWTPKSDAAAKPTAP